MDLSSLSVCLASPDAWDSSLTEGVSVSNSGPCRRSERLEDDSSSARDSLSMADIKTCGLKRVSGQFGIGFAIFRIGRMPFGDMICIMC